MINLNNSSSSLSRAFPAGPFELELSKFHTTYYDSDRIFLFLAFSIFYYSFKFISNMNVQNYMYDDVWKSSLLSRNFGSENNIHLKLITFKILMEVFAARFFGNL